MMLRKSIIFAIHLGFQFSIQMPTMFGSIRAIV
jgi:hypothetical protein